MECGVCADASEVVTEDANMEDTVVGVKTPKQVSPHLLTAFEVYNHTTASVLAREFRRFCNYQRPSGLVEVK